MQKIECMLCDKTIIVEDYDFARWCKGELVLCEQCQETFDKGKSKTKESRSE